MNEIALDVFNKTLEDIIEKTAGDVYKLKIPKSMVGKAGLLGVGGVLGAMGQQAYSDHQLGASIRRQQS